MKYTGRPPAVKAPGAAREGEGRDVPDIAIICLTCGVRGRLDLAGDGAAPASWRCPRCAAPLPLKAPREVSPARPIATCAVCGDDKLFIQKPFSQKVGCLIVGVGAALVPWTYGLSLAVCALLDYLLYRTLPTITVCYVCKSRYSGVPLNPRHAPFDLMTAQTYEARALNWRR